MYRAAPPTWATAKDILSGNGAFKSGGRFNAAGIFPAIYGSTSPELAMMESLAYQRRAGVPVERAFPLVFKAVSVEVERLLDLTDPVVLAELQLDVEQLRAEPWWLARARGQESHGQAVGRAIYSAGLQGLVAASSPSLDHGSNIVLFPDRLTPGHCRLAVIRRKRR
jgi:RES domain-containing protein